MNNLKYYRKKTGSTQQEIASLIGVTQTAYGNYELGKRQIPFEHMLKLADYYKVSIEDLMGRGSLNNVGRHPEQKPELVAEEEVLIPLVASLRCGPGDSGEPFTYVKPIPIPASYVRRWGDGLQAIIAVGESMSPTIIPGDMLICRPGSDWTDGNVVSVNYSDNDMIKRIYRTKDGGVDLRSDSSKFETIHVTAEEINCGHFHVLGRLLLPIGKEL